MAVTKILARKGRLDVGVRYVLNGDKTEEQILTASQGCSTEHAVSRMMKTKRHYRQTDGVQYYHIIQSFKPGEVTPELALEIAREFAAEHLPGYQAVIGVHVDKEHIHAHTIFNSVNADTGEKYHSNARSYYSQIRAISDRLCREHGLSIIMEGKGEKAVSYIEWLRQSKGQPTFRAMLEADLREAIEDANDIGHFFLIMEHKGYEIKHGNRLGFRLRGQDRFMVPGRKNPLFTEDGIRRLFQVDEVQHPNVVALAFEVAASGGQYLHFRIGDHIVGIRLQNVGQHIAAGLGRAAAADDQYVEGPAVLVGIQPQADMLCQGLILLLTEHGVDLFGGRPLGGAVFLAVAGTALGGAVEADPHDIEAGAGENAHQAVFRPADLQRGLQGCGQVRQQFRQAVPEGLGDQERGPDHGDVEKQIREKPSRSARLIQRHSPPNIKKQGAHRGGAPRRLMGCMPV